MIRSQHIGSTGENVFEEGQRVLMPTEPIEVERLESLGRERARIVCPKMKPGMCGDIRPEPKCFLVATHLLQSFCNLSLGVYRHRRFGAVVTGRPVESGLSGLKRRLGIRIDLLGGTTCCPGDPMT